MFRGFKLNKDVKAFEVPNDPPYLGDFRTTKDYPAGTLWEEITEFEVWDGSKWVKPDQTYNVQE